MWGGRFSTPTSQVLRRLNDSFWFDRRLVGEDVEGSIAWARELHLCGALTKREADRLVKALAAIDHEEVLAARPDEAEDIHSFVEASLVRTLGHLAGKLHTGRSRNDQVATDLRLYLKRALLEGCHLALDLAEGLSRRALAESGTPLPGYTHLKRAEPITFGHWCLSYVEMLLRDASRMTDAVDRGDECPLGSGALSGTPLPVDRARLARALGFSRPTANSLDAVSDRDMAAEYLFAGALTLAHLSRLAEDLILYSSDEFRFVALPDALSTGSSRMPHKKNPDLLELARGQASRAAGDLTGLLGLMKGLPSSYNKDLQLDKEPVFRMRDTLGLVLPALTALIEQVSLDRRRMRGAAADESLLATGLTDAMAARGVPFRRAHETVGRRISLAASRRMGLAELGPGGGIKASDFDALRVESALAKRASFGGTAPACVKTSARQALRRIQESRKAARS